MRLHNDRGMRIKSEALRLAARHKKSALLGQIKNDHHLYFFFFKLFSSLLAP